MNGIKDIEQKIAGLLHKKEQLRQKSATMLYRKLEGLMGDKFCPELVMGIVVGQWQNTTPLLQAKWQNEGALFFRLVSAQGHAKDQPEGKHARTPQAEIQA